MTKVLKQIKEQGEQARLTMSVPEAAFRLGIGRNQGYECARRGEIPTIRLGKRMVVPVVAFEAMLAVKSKQQVVATELVRRLQRDEAEVA
jgi:excisionase family DNA binding protein